MLNTSIDKILEVNQRIERYHFRLQYTPTLLIQGEVDLQLGRQHILMGMDPETFPQAEIYWRGEQGIGRKLSSEVWLRLRGQPIPDYLHLAIKLLRENEPVAVQTEASFWKLEFQPNRLPIRDDPIGFFTTIFGEPQDTKSRDFLQRAAEMVSRMETSLIIYISQEDLLVREVHSRVQTGEVNAGIAASFEPMEGEVPPLPEGVPLLEGPAVPPEMLLLELDRIAGWADLKTHSPWAQRTIELIEQKDNVAPPKQQKYREIYDRAWYSEGFTEQIARSPAVTKPDPNKHHPIVVGAYYEDWGKQFPQFYKTWFNNDPLVTSDPNFQPDGYYRDYHHFGGYDTGLEHAWYFIFRGSPDTVVDGRYYSARDWGYGANRIHENLNRMTFTQAIRQYNRYSWEGQRNAFLILGHVIHLLQDQAQPDHPRLVAHAGSAMDEKEAYNRYHYCHILAAEAAAVACDFCTIFCGICAAGAFGITEAVCHGTTDENEMGYEKLISELWNLSRVEDDIHLTGILTRHNYDTFFQEMSDFAITQANQRNLDSALGCSTLVLVPPIPGADPDIQSNDLDEREPFMELTDALVPKMIGLSAGLIQYFYEIVNHPPYVQRVVVIKGGPELTPQGFAKFAPESSAATCSKLPVRYDVEWQKVSSTARTKHVAVNQPLSASNHAYVFIQFGPNLARPGSNIKSKSVREETLNLTLTGMAANNEQVNIVVPLQVAEDPEIGTYYWGSFQPANPGIQPFSLRLNIRAKDTAAHLIQRSQPGDDLDANPQTVARVDSGSSPLFPLIDYQPGVDQNHSIEITGPIGPDQFEPNNDFEQATVVNLGLPTRSTWNTEDAATVYEGLTLHKQGDEDFFHIHFQISEWDAGESNFWLETLLPDGLYVEHHPATLSIEVEEVFGACLTVELYHSNQSPYRKIEYADSIKVESPVHVFPTQQFFLAIKNPDFVKQGPLAYSLRMQYRPYFMSLRGQLLYRFWEVIVPHVSPPPIHPVGNPPETLVYLDFQRLVSDVESFLPHHLDDLGIDERLPAEAIIRAGLGRVAHRIRLYGAAERMFAVSANRFREVEFAWEEADVLRDLQEVYIALGREADVESITTRLAAIRGR